MKSIVRANENVAFPGLYLGDKGNIVLLTDERTGVVVGSVEGASRPKPIGYSGNWVFSKFVPFKGEVTLSA